MDEITEDMFWLKKPVAMGWQGWSLLIPSVASGVGFFCFGVLGLSFTELEYLPQAFRIALVLIGSFSLLIGTELGTVANVVEIYRRGEQLGKWDKFSLVVSLLSTVGVFVMSFATLLGAKAQWSQSVKLYGPIVLGLLSGLDSYGGFMTFGLYLNSYDKRMNWWQLQFAEFKKNMMAMQWEQKGKQKNDVVQEPAICWCGKQLKSKRAYSSHLRYHINEVQQYDDAQSALDGLHRKYADVVTADFAFPTLTDVVEWRS